MTHRLKIRWSPVSRDHRVRCEACGWASWAKTIPGAHALAKVHVDDEASVCPLRRQAVDEETLRDLTRDLDR